MASLSIKNVPEDVVENLRLRALRHHRSLQGELMSIITESAYPPFDVDAFVAETKRLGISTPDDSVAMIREDRDRADGRH